MRTLTSRQVETQLLIINNEFKKVEEKYLDLKQEIFQLESALAVLEKYGKEIEKSSEEENFECELRGEGLKYKWVDLRDADADAADAAAYAADAK